MKQKHTQSLRGNERKENNEKTGVREERGGHPGPADKAVPRLHIYNASKDMRKGLDWISSIKKKKKKSKSSLTQKEGSITQP